MRVGDAVVAIGHPFGLDRTATAGIVSGVGREIQAPDGFQIDEVIQTDAPINPGNSGGPLLDARGRVVGVNTQIATGGAGGGNVGIGFAVPSNTVREVLPALSRGETIERPYLGVTTAPHRDGAEVQEIVPGSPADSRRARAGRRDHRRSTAARCATPTTSRTRSRASSRATRSRSRSRATASSRRASRSSSARAPAQRPVSFQSRRSSCSRCARAGRGRRSTC